MAFLAVYIGENLKKIQPDTGYYIHTSEYFNKTQNNILDTPKKDNIMKIYFVLTKLHTYRHTSKAISNFVNSNMSYDVLLTKFIPISILYMTNTDSSVLSQKLLQLCLKHVLCTRIFKCSQLT